MNPKVFYGREKIMHEYSIAESLVESAIQSSENRKIVSMQIKVGTLSGVCIESLTFFVDLIMEERGFKSVEISTETESPMMECECGNEYLAKKIFDPCPICGTYSRKVLSGNDCILKSIEVDE